MLSARQVRRLCFALRHGDSPFTLPRQPRRMAVCRVGQLIVQYYLCQGIKRRTLLGKLPAGFLQCGTGQIIHFLPESCPVVRGQFARTINELRNTGHLCIVHRSEQVCNFLALVIGELQNIRGTQVFICKQASGRLSDQRRIPLEEGFVVNGLADGKAVTQETPALLTGRSSLFSLISTINSLSPLVSLKLSPSTP